MKMDISLDQQFSLELKKVCRSTSKKSSAQFSLASPWIATMMLSILSMETNMATALPFSRATEPPQENLLTRLNAARLASMYLFQCLCQCSLSQATRSQSEVI